MVVGSRTVLASSSINALISCSRSYFCKGFQMNLQDEVMQVFNKTEQMLEYRQNKLTQPDVPVWTQKAIKQEINVLNFLKRYASEALEARGVEVEQPTS